MTKEEGTPASRGAASEGGQRRDEESKIAPDGLADNPHDAATLLRSLDGAPINKIVARGADGAVTKDVARSSGHFNAEVLPVPDLEAMAAILRQIGGLPDAVLSLGVPKSRPTKPFRVAPMKALAAALGVDAKNRQALAGVHRVDGTTTAARTNETFVHGRWFLVDRDAAPGMPGALAGLSFDAWVAAMDLLLPGFAGCGKAVAPSTTGRVTVNGQPMHSAGCHVLIHVLDPGDMIERVWPQLLAKSFVTEVDGVPLGFVKECRARMARPGVEVSDVVSRVPWSIFDTSVIGPERLVFDGAPTVRGEGLAVLPPDVRVINGPSLDTTRFVDLDDAAIAEVESRSMATVERRKGTNGARPRIVGLSTSTADLALSSVLETEDGDRTIEELWLQGVGHVRCQAPFRPESASWASYYNVHLDGSPFVLRHAMQARAEG